MINYDCPFKTGSAEISTLAKCYNASHTVLFRQCVHFWSKYVNNSLSFVLLDKLRAIFFVYAYL